MQNHNSQKFFGLLVVLAAIFFSGIASAQDNKLIISTGNPDGLMGAASRRASPGKLETETADDFTLDQTTVISRATIVGLVPSGTQPQDIKEVEVEVYHVFPRDSANPALRQGALADQLAL